MFRLHERLAADTVEVTALDLSLVLLLDDARFPWLVLVPRRARIGEIHQLAAADRALLMDELVLASRAMEALFQPDKLNIGALGNIVPQLHVHVIGRRRDDAAWPGPAWGSGPAVAHAPEALARSTARLRDALASAR